MTTRQVKPVILDIIGKIAPEIPPPSIDPDAALQEELDIDSMDFLRIVVGIKEQLGVEIPEKDYREVATLNSLVHYVQGRLE